MPPKNARETAPFTPDPVKYSCFARNDTFRGAMSVIAGESMKDRWLLARITAPCRGTFRRPTIRGRHSSRASGVTTARLRAVASFVDPDTRASS